MNFARWMVVPQKTPWDYRDRVFFVVDMSQVKMRVDVICKCLVPDARHAVCDSGKRNPRKVKRQIHTVEESDSSTWMMVVVWCYCPYIMAHLGNAQQL